MVVGGIVAAIMLLLADRPPAIADDLQPAQAGFDAAAGTTGGVLAAPVRWTGDAVGFVKGYFFAVSENRRLRRELEIGRASCRERVETPDGIRDFHVTGVQTCALPI